VVTNYQYDTANRLEYVNDQAYTWDNNGNLLNDGASSYTYDHADRLTGVSSSGITASYAYNGVGNRLQQIVNGVAQDYTLDLAGGLTQVLSDGEITYLYGNGRIAQYTGTTPEYFLGDALGSVRQLVDGSGNVAMAKEYEPYGEVMNSTWGASSPYGFTNEWTDNTGLVYLRARYYDPTIGRFMTRDTWGGDMNQPMSYNAWIYSLANPINYTDPYGLCASGDQACVEIAQQIFHDYGWMLNGKWQLSEVNILLDSAQQISNFFNEHGGNGQARMRGSISPVWFSHANIIWVHLGYHHVFGQTIYMIPGFYDEKVIHESAHVLDNLSGGPITASIRGGGPSDDMVRYLGVDPTQCILRYWCPKYLSLLRMAVTEVPPSSYGENGPSEDFAETFRLIVQNRLDSNAFPMRWNWMVDFIQNESRTRSAYGGDPYQYLWFLPQPIPVPACSVPQPIATPQP
jgi:RHS repeat-associated protein